MTQHVLITGSTSGLGLGLAKHYLAQGGRVSVVNRRPLECDGDYFLTRQLAAAHYLVDVRDRGAVTKLVLDLRERGDFPDLWILSAGINKPDIHHRYYFEAATFHDVLRTNLAGVLHFVAAIQAHRPDDCPPTNIACVSSTSIIVGHPDTQAYNLSKVALHTIFRRLDRAERDYLGHRLNHRIRYRSLILGPIATNIGTSTPSSWVQRRVRDWVTVSVDEAVPMIAKFLEGKRQALWWPRRAVWTMRALKIALKIAPGVYRG